MDRVLFGTALLLGAIAVFWIGLIFVDSNVLAFTITAVIGGVYSIGCVELFKFRSATLTLEKALRTANEKIDHLDEWLDHLDPSLRNAVRSRIEGERVGLPAPMLTPYLVGLLVMLGLLGTFVGMVDTLRGAVIVIEGTTELQAIRDGLAAPIKGLGLAFGTSVAGVATSAMLGLMSTLCRRHRMLETRQLDTKISTLFQGFSLIHSQRETFSALARQTQALPAVAEKLDAMADKLGFLGETLIENQNQHHASVKANFSELTKSMDMAFKENLTENIRLVGETIQPILSVAMTDIARETQKVHNQITLSAREDIEALSQRFAAQSGEVAQSWKAGLEAHNHSNDALLERMHDSFEALKEQFKGMTASMLSSYQTSASSWLERMVDNDKSRLNVWADTLGKAQKEASVHLVDASREMTGELKQVTDTHQAALQSTVQDFLSISASLADGWRKTGEETRSGQKEITASLTQTARELATRAQTAASLMQEELSRVLQSSEKLIDSRVEAEAAWLEGHHHRMDRLGSTLRDDLGALRDDEERRGQAAVERLEKLTSVLTSHLTILGQSLEAPMSRLIQSAAEAPRAAAEVIDQLRQEASKRIQGDNHLLKEQCRVIAELDSLSTSLALSSTEQRETIEQLVNASKTMMDNVGRRFAEQVDTKVTAISEVADTFAGSAAEMASLGDAFRVAVDLFNSANGDLIENLTRIEASLDKATTRSDDQLGYYVAQAREMIDHSILSQKEIIDALRQFAPKHDTHPEVG